MSTNIRVLIQHYPGYGAPEAWKICVICDNRLLEERSIGDARSCGREEVLLEQKWCKRSRRGGWEAKLAQSPLASLLCSVCSGDTLDGITYVNGRHFCTKATCQAAIHPYQDALQQSLNEFRRRHSILIP